MLEALTGTGLAAAAGLNAYVPLVVLGLLARYTDVLTLPAAWQWLENGWLLGVLALLLAVELVADKVPVVDSVNDVVQTAVRPAAGGLAFGAGSVATTPAVADPSGSGPGWVPVAAGVVLALLVHLGKAAARPVLNAATVGAGAPVVSAVEDAGSVGLVVAALVVPVLAAVAVVALLALLVVAVRRRRLRARPG